LYLTGSAAIAPSGHHFFSPNTIQNDCFPFYSNTIIFGRAAMAGASAKPVLYNLKQPGGEGFVLSCLAAVNSIPGKLIINKKILRLLLSLG
jgi:hypothetical protein